ncbi:DUF5992 family protein [Aliiglaciecola sp. M165]|uniref:DUF5992 family protein n=1 Tax=Aliiglaciecola sp. M165 TaxID=2593649 RepID=UPI0011804F51|nr:DUF5992 family protein [Aliiglaciecola sp. M165]TRY28671.1 hypothetical protein FM019_20640 [Aliiglaciecola sp. M165]
MKKALFLLLFSFSEYSDAAWLNTTGTVSDVITYASTETVLVVLSSNGAPVEECSNTTTFAISKSISEEARARMFSILLAAKTTGSSVTLSYNDVGGCEPWDANSSAYRKITRLR